MLSELVETKEKLLPCPFCGGEAELRYSTPYAHTYFVFCKKCGLVAFETRIDSDTIAAWNTRAKPYITPEILAQFQSKGMQSGRHCNPPGPTGR